MKIAIGGLSGSGKTTLAKNLAEKLGIDHITFSFKTLAKQKGMTLLEFQEMAKNNPDIDKEFDKMIHDSLKDKDHFVISTWLGGWYDKLFGVNYDLKVWLSTSIEERAKRLSKRDEMTIKEAKEHLEARDEQNRQRYLEFYEIDIFDNSNFDLKLTNTTLSKKQTLDAVLQFFSGQND